MLRLLIIRNNGLYLLKGALRKSARELELEVQAMEQQVRRRTQDTKEKQPAMRKIFSKDITEKLEKLRRGER